MNAFLLSVSKSHYLMRVFFIGIGSWLYWESLNQSPFEWWSIDGYPTLVAAKLWVAGHSEAIYNPTLWIYDGGNPLWKKQMISLGILNAGTAFVYHPLYLFVLAPFINGLTADQFAYLLVFTNALSLGIVGAESFRFAEKYTRSESWLVLCCVAICFPALYGAYLGQNILPTLALIMLSFHLLEQGRVITAALILTLSVAMKVWVLPIVVLLLLMHGRKAVAIGATIMIVGLLLVPFVVNSALLSAYFDIALRLSDITVYPYNNVSIRAALERSNDVYWVEDAFRWVPQSISTRTRIVEKVVQLTLATLAAVFWLRNRPSRRITFVAALALLLALPGVCWSHYLVFCIPLLICMTLSEKGFIKWFGWASLILFALPWHGLPTQRAAWPIKEIILKNPDFMALAISIPLVWSIIAGLLALAMANKRDRSFGASATVECSGRD